MKAWWLVNFKFSKRMTFLIPTERIFVDIFWILRKLIEAEQCVVWFSQPFPISFYALIWYNNNYSIFAFAIVQSTISDLLKDSNSLGLEWKSLGQARQAVVMYGGIQVLRHYDFDLFWPTHPLYHQTSSFPIPTLMMTSSFPHTQPPINIFSLLSLIN